MTKCKFKVGDRVRVKADLERDKQYFTEDGEVCESFVSEMVKHKGEVVTISRIIGNEYKIKEDNGDWFWVGEMFEPICKFKVGDYVVCNTNIFCTIDKGWVGKIVKILPNNEVKVEGQYRIVQSDSKYFDLYTKDQPTKIVITTDGKTTTAKMYRDKSVVKVETTKCHPDDRFDFMVGARVAFDRLVSEKKEEPKYYNGKVVCVDNCGYSFYTKGKIYQFVDGVAFDDNGNKFSYSLRLKSFEQFTGWSDAKWLEVVE